MEKFPTLTEVSVHAFIRDIISKSHVVKHVKPAFDLIRDPKDEPYIDLAVTVRADFLVTSDRDLLDLMTGIDVESKQFRQRFRRLKIVTPREFLNLVESREISLAP